MTHPDIPKLAAAMDKSPAFKAFIESSATPLGLDLLAKYREQQVRRSQWMHRLTVLFILLAVLFVAVSFVALGWGFHAACRVC